jgi:hypothetical protein
VLSGDVILAVGGTNVSTVEELQRAVAEAGTSTSLRILRGNQELTLDVSLAATSPFPGFENLPRQLQERLRELADAGNLTAEQLQRLAQGFQNNVAIGTVKAIDPNGITVTPLPGGNDVTYSLTEQTEYRTGGDQASRADITSGSTVVVISMDGRTALAVIRYAR